MWLVGFVTHLPLLRLDPMPVGILLLITFAGMMIATGRYAAPDRPLRIGAFAGLISGLVNLLILGALLTTDDGAAHPAWPIAVAGWLAASALVGAGFAWLGAQLAGASAATRRTPQQWVAGFSLVAMLSAIPVIMSGGLVTSSGAGLSVADWPTSYNANMFLFPLSKMTGGIYYEHAHRLLGSLVGLTALTLVIFAFVARARPGVRWASVAIFVLVCIQGTLGGIRVTAAEDPSGARAQTVATAPAEAARNFAATQDSFASVTYAVIHGVGGQLTLASLCFLAAFASTRWATRCNLPQRRDGLMRWAGLLLVVTLLVQLILGATSRHLEHPHLAYTHMGFAAIVTVVLCFAALRGTTYRGSPLPAAGWAAVSLVIVQVLLGFVVLMFVLPTYDGDHLAEDTTATILLATAHQGLGAALLGIAAIIAAWGWRLTSPATESEQAYVGEPPHRPAAVPA
jgi:heme a synthase